MADVTLTHIYKVYPNGTKAVKDFNMQIQDKEFIVFVGPSGCGKSTTLRMIAGLEDISAGELKIGDLIVNDMEPKDRDIAMVFQNYALYPHMTVYENIAFGLRLRKLSKDEIHRKVVEAANILGITEYLNKKPKEMSGGQRQRVALGRAIVREPKVMLLDEPLSNLDAKLRTQMRAEIGKLHSKLQTTFIYVTHDQVEAMTMGTRIVVMKDGLVQQIDTPKNLYNYPGNKFVAGFIGTPQMNFFEGTLLKKGDDVQIKFEYTDAEITVPYSMLYKAKLSYLDGNSVVYIGLRPEDISLASGDVNNNKAVVKVVVSHKEDLGSETLVYGDINPNGDGYVESSTRIIIKDNSGRELKAGDVVEAALNINRVHLFDKKTEESVLPRVPEYNYLDCEINKGKIKFLGAEIRLPASVNTEDLKGELLLPTDAVTLDGDLQAEVVSCEEINGVYLLSLTLGGKRLYAVLPEPVDAKTVGIGIDFKKITVTACGENKIVPMPEVNAFPCKFVKQKICERVEVNGKTKKKKSVQFGLTVAGAFFGVADETAQKIFTALGIKNAYAANLRLECGIDRIAVAESGIAAEAVQTLDYGKEKYLKCKVGDSFIYVKTEAEYTGNICLLPDFEHVGIVEIEREIKII